MANGFSRQRKTMHPGPQRIHATTQGMLIHAITNYHFGGGGFPWRTEAVCDRVRNVTEVQSGHANGQTSNPLYKQVCTGKSVHTEVVRATSLPAGLRSTQAARALLAIFCVTPAGSSVWCQSRSSTGTGQRGGQPRHGVPPFAHL